MHRFSAAVLVTALFAACSGGDGETRPSTTTTTEAPAPEHGALLEQAEVEAGTGAPTWFVRYASVSPEDEPIEVTGLVVVPEGEPKGILTWAHGTTGIGDTCAPSADPPGSVGWLSPFVADGWILAATDYEGLGTPGRHPYLHRTSEGRGTLDIVRAAAELAGIDADELPVMIWGHSQGGHAALSAGELAAEWTPELDVRGVVAGAPATELPLIATTLRNGGGVSAFLSMVFSGWSDAEPERADLELVLTPEAIAAIAEEPGVGCTDEYFAASADLEGRFTIVDPTTVEPWATLFRENDPGHVVTDIPILVVHGEADPLVPPPLSQLFHDRVCGLGQVIERRTYPGADHGTVIGAAWTDTVAWMDARLAGEPAPSTCPASP